MLVIAHPFTSLPELVPVVPAHFIQFLLIMYSTGRHLYTRKLCAISDDLIDQAKINGFVTTHEIVTICVFFNLIQ